MRARISDDLPALVYPTSATRKWSPRAERRCSSSSWISSSCAFSSARRSRTLPAVEVDVGLARTDAALSAAPRGGLSKAWDDVLQPGHLHLELRLAAARVAVEDLHDHACPVEHFGAGRPLQVARLARGNLMVDDHDVGRWLRVRPWRLRRGSQLGARVKAPSRLRRRWGRHRADHARSTGERRQVVQPPLAQHGCPIKRFASLRQGADDLVAQCLHQAGLVPRCLPHEPRHRRREAGRRRGWHAGRRVWFPCVCVARSEGLFPHPARLKSLGLVSARLFRVRRRFREITGDAVRDAWIVLANPSGPRA